VRLARTPDGRRLEVTRRIDADPDRVWTVFIDTELWPRWGPSVTDVECSDRFVREGSTGRVRVPIGLWLPFVVRTCTDRRWTWDVAGVPATGHRVEAAGDGSLATFELPPLAAGYAPVCRRALRRIGELAEGKRS
jgi:uncharacterized protein YndB with AHSA1/START domain